ncbi:MAG: host attachment protein, partial [Verrucomicrobiae bacterium]|nr:host attachment protein [Verrucomicrobiae bacterium]MDW7980026.1 host attachment protein [Verrucomicrobiales bacterium]
GLLRAYKLSRDDTDPRPRLELVDEVELKEAHHRVTDMVSDQAGRFASSAHPGASAGERHNIELEHRKRLIKQLADHVAVLLRREHVETCYLAASKEINHKILDLLPHDVRAKITKNIAADLTKLGKAELLERFAAEP